MAVLKYHTQGTAQILLLNLIDVDTVVTDLSVLNIVKPVNQVGNGRFSGSGSAYKGHLLSGLRVELNVVKYGFFRCIAEVYPVHNYVALQLRVCDGTVMMGMLPGPDTGTLRHLHQLVTLIAGIDQGHITAVLLRGLIHQVEDSLRACQGHNDRVKLLGNLGNRLVEASCQLQEGGKTAQGQAADPADGQQRSYNGGQHIIDISNISHYRHQHVGIDVRVAGTVKELVVQLLEFCLGFFLMAEDLYHLLAVHHFLNVAVDFTQILLLRHKVPAGLAADFLDDICHDEYHGNDHQGQNRA